MHCSGHGLLNHANVEAEEVLQTNSLDRGIITKWTNYGWFRRWQLRQAKTGFHSLDSKMLSHNQVVGLSNRPDCIIRKHQGPMLEAVWQKMQLFLKKREVKKRNGICSFDVPWQVTQDAPMNLQVFTALGCHMPMTVNMLLQPSGLYFCFISKIKLWGNLYANNN